MSEEGATRDELYEKYKEGYMFVMQLMAPEGMSPEEIEKECLETFERAYPGPKPKATA